jgi:hypothetical protein
VAATSIGIAFGAAWACLPDLEISAPPAVCGDGFIDPDAGEECDPGEAGDAGTQASPCVACKVACSNGSELEDPATQHCYLQAGETATKGAAISDCEAWGGHIVRLVSDDELSLVANDAITDPFWIGLGRTAIGMWQPLETTFEPGWAQDCAGCFAHVDAGTIPADPAEGAADQACVIGFKPVGPSWTESQCSAPAQKTFARLAVCEREPVGLRTRACGANACLSVAATQSSKRYVVVGAASDGGLGANDAVLACSALGGRLAVLGSPEEREQLGHELGAYFGGAPSAWIGLSYVDGTWAWDGPDAGGMVSLPWGVGEPANIEVSFGRAFVKVAPTQLDSELAHAASSVDGGGALHAALCEVP